MNLSETAFVQERRDGDFDLRWFTPTTEVDLCGHATLAGAHVVWEENLRPRNSEIRFHTRSGVLPTRWGERGIEMDFPAWPELAAELPPGLVEALAVKPEYVGRTETDHLIELASESAVRTVRPDFRRLASVPMRTVAVTAAATSAESPRGYDFVSRFFAPAVGVDEDPVTGSAHCCLGPFWRGRLTGFQALGAWWIRGSLGDGRPSLSFGAGCDGLPRRPVVLRCGSTRVTRRCTRSNQALREGCLCWKTRDCLVE